MARPPPVTSILAQRRPCVVLGVASPPPAWHRESPSAIALAELAGVEPERLGSNFALDNLLPLEKPSRTALREAGEMYVFEEKFWYIVVGTETVRALGKRVLPLKTSRSTNGRVSWSMSGRGIEPFSWYETREGVVMSVVPHPSGNNPWYNDVDKRKKAEKFLRDACWTRRDSAHTAWVKARAR